jgi:hypothetical protein
MTFLCLITVPGLEVSSDWRPIHDRLLDEFPQVTDVLATTMKETILVVYDDAAPGDAGQWLDAVSDAILNRRLSASAQRNVERATRIRGSKQSTAIFRSRQTR